MQGTTTTPLYVDLNKIQARQMQRVMLSLDPHFYEGGEDSPWDSLWGSISVSRLRFGSEDATVGFVVNQANAKPPTEVYLAVSLCTCRGMGEQ